MTREVAWTHRDEALELLYDALHWAHLNPTRWMEFEAVVAKLSAAVDSGSWQAATELVTHMFLMEPLRCPPPPDGVSTPPTAAAAVVELTKKIESNTYSANATPSAGNQ